MYDIHFVYLHRYLLFTHNSYRRSTLNAMSCTFLYYIAINTERFLNTFRLIIER